MRVVPDVRFCVFRPSGAVLSVSVHGARVATEQQPPWHVVFGAGLGLGDFRDAGRRVVGSPRGTQAAADCRGHPVFAVLSPLGAGRGVPQPVAVSRHHGVGRGAHPAVVPIDDGGGVIAASPHRRGLNMGLLQGSAAGLLGAVIGPPVLIALAQAYGWRHAFIVSLLPGLLIAWLIWRYVRQDEPRQAPVSNVKLTGHRLALLKSRNIVLCTLISCVFLTWFVILISFTPTFLVSVRGYSAPSMGTIMSCLGAAWVVWGFAVPSISDRIGRRPTLVLFSLIAACCPIALLFAPSPMILGVLMVLTFTGLGCFTLFMSTIPAETVPREVMATALGMIMGVGELVGGFMAPTIAGFAADQFGLSIVMWISCCGAVLAAGLSLLLKETAPTVLQRRSLQACTQRA
ncbi:Major facilitator family transporter [Pseudomonas syringae pv. antirrhini]|nr:Major facilitator family transporter [Pseudomonas syringae pv. antirrhini]